MTRIGDYEVLRPLEGHEREVLLAEDAKGGRRVLALFTLDDAPVDALEEELERCRAIDHPHVTPARESFRHEDKLVLVYEAAPGATLDRLLAHLADNREQLSDGSALHIGACLCHALAAAHTAKHPTTKSVSPLVHAQLGTHQIFLAWDGGVQVLGLGLSTIFRLATGMGEISERAQPYLAPEVRKGGALTVQALFDRIDTLAESADDERSQTVLEALYEWGEMVAPEA